MDLARLRLGHLRPGIELGRSAINPFPGVTAWNVDLPNQEVFERAQLERAGSVARIDVVASAAHLPFEDGSLAFVLASHVVEHMNDPIRALCEWDRVVRPGGVIFLIVPHRDRTFDRTRPRTPLRHLLSDYAQRMTAERDFLAPTSHHHVWITGDFVELIDFMNAVGAVAWDLTDVEDVDSNVGHGFTVVLRKRTDRARAPKVSVAEPPFRHFRLRLPFQPTGRIVEAFVGEGEALPADLPNGVYQVSHVRGTWPPAVERTEDVEVGPPTPAPVIETVDRDGDVVRLVGRHFTASTYAECFTEEGATHRVLPDFREGSLLYALPRRDAAPIRVSVRAVNLGPGGGAGPTIPAVL